MASTAILTYAHRFTVQGLNALGVPVGAIVTLQTQKVTTSKTRGKIDLTNAESPAGRAEFAYGVLHGKFDIAGIVDAGIGFETIFTYCLDGAFYGLCNFYLAKPTGANNPVIYSGYVLWGDAKLIWETSAEGNIGKFEANGDIVGSLVRSGVDITYTVGAPS